MDRTAVEEGELAGDGGELHRYASLSSAVSALGVEGLVGALLAQLRELRGESAEEENERVGGSGQGI